MGKRSRRRQKQMLEEEIEEERITGAMKKLKEVEESLKGKGEDTTSTAEPSKESVVTQEDMHVVHFEEVLQSEGASQEIMSTDEHNYQSANYNYIQVKSEPQEYQAQQHQQVYQTEQEEYQEMDHEPDLSVNFVSSHIEYNMEPRSPGYTHEKFQDEHGRDVSWTFRCKYCEFATQERVTIKRHIILHKGDPTIQSPESLKYRKTKTDNRKFQCPLCLYKAIQKIHLDLHIKSRHYGQKPYACTLCDYRAAQKVGLERHIKGKHTNEKPYLCDLCDYRTVQKVNLDRHRMSKHSNGNMLGCPYCVHKTALQVHLDQHIKRVHCSDKLLQCNYCPIQTFDKYAFKSHPCMQNLAKSSISQTCNICNGIFSSKLSLNRHIKTKHMDQSNKICSYCDAIFENPIAFKKHLKTHESSAYQCEICDFMTPHQLDLNTHVKIEHSMEMKYICYICNFSTNTFNYIKLHIRKEHPQNEPAIQGSTYVMEYKPLNERIETYFEDDESSYPTVKQEIDDEMTYDEEEFTTHIETKDVVCIIESNDSEVVEEFVCEQEICYEDDS